MGLIPMVFYALVNACALVLETVWIAVGRPDVIGWYRRVSGRDDVDDPVRRGVLASEKPAMSKAMGKDR